MRSTRDLTFCHSFKTFNVFYLLPAIAKVKTLGNFQKNKFEDIFVMFYNHFEMVKTKIVFHKYS